MTVKYEKCSLNVPINYSLNIDRNLAKSMHMVINIYKVFHN